jgi:hypothetical protein
VKNKKNKNRNIPSCKSLLLGKIIMKFKGEKMLLSFKIPKKCCQKNFDFWRTKARDT